MPTRRRRGSPAAYDPSTSPEPPQQPARVRSAKKRGADPVEDAEANPDPADAARDLALRSAQAAAAGRLDEARQLAGLADTLSKLAVRLAPPPARDEDDDEADPDSLSFLDFERTLEEVEAWEQRREARSFQRLDPERRPFSKDEPPPHGPPCAEACHWTRLKAHWGRALRANAAAEWPDHEYGPLEDEEVFVWAAMAADLGMRMGDPVLDEALDALSASGWDATRAAETGRDLRARLLDPLDEKQLIAIGDAVGIPNYPVRGVLGALPRITPL